MPNISIIVRNKNAQAIGNNRIVCGNSDYIAVFDFDAEWDAYPTKTARFIWNGKYADVVFTGNECSFPIITNAVGVEVGVYAGDLHTTTAAAIDTTESILCRNGHPAAPPPDVYAQIMDKLNELSQGGASPEAIGEAVEEYFTENPIDAEEIGAVAQNQGKENADKILGIDASGKVVPVDKPQGDVKTVAGVSPDSDGNVPLDKSNVGLGNVDNVKQYSKYNPPPYPVTSVNGKTGAVQLSASDVGADSAGTAFKPGNALELTQDGTLNVLTATEAEEDNTLPITAAAVYTEIGNIEILLKTI